MSPVDVTSEVVIYDKNDGGKRPLIQRAGQFDNTVRIFEWLAADVNIVIVLRRTTDDQWLRRAIVKNQQVTTEEHYGIQRR